MIRELKKIWNSENKQYQSFQDELFSQINKDTLMKETLQFNNDNLKENYCRIILMKLIYFINQGYIIDKEEKELLFFRITKLLNFQNPFLRRMTYKIMKLIINQEYEFIITSSLKKDINSSNKYIKSFAINLVPYLSDISNIMEFQIYIQQAIVNKSKLISTTALLSGLNIFLKYPNIVSSWHKEMKDSLEDQNGHALLLQYKIQKDKNLFFKDSYLNNSIQTITSFYYECIKVYQGNSIVPQKKFHQFRILFPKIQYLFLQLSSKDDLLIFEAFKIIMMIESLPENLTRSLINILCGFLRPEVVNISQYTSLQILKNLSNLNDINNLVDNKILLQLEDYLIYSPHAGVSAYSLFLCMKIKNEFDSTYLIKICLKTNGLSEQINLLQGLIVFLDVFNILGREILRFLEIIITKDSSDDLIKQAFKVIKFMLKDVNQKLYLKSIHTLLSIAAKCENKYKSKVVLLIHKEFYLSPIKKINESDAYDQFLGFQDLFSKIQDFTIVGSIKEYYNDAKILLPLSKLLFMKEIQLMIKTKKKPLTQQKNEELIVLLVIDQILNILIGRANDFVHLGTSFPKRYYFNNFDNREYLIILVKITIQKPQHHLIQQKWSNIGFGVSQWFLPVTENQWQMIKSSEFESSGAKNIASLNFVDQTIRHKFIYQIIQISKVYLVFKSMGQERNLQTYLWILQYDKQCYLLILRSTIIINQYEG
ncbi:hypothetical protein pb186bvf_000725 [Paramecium bursaria]